VPRLKEVDLFESVARAQTYLKDSGVYIISGGTGGVGRLLSLYLHKQFNAKLILIGRSPETSIKVQDCLSFLETQSVLYTYVQGDIGREDIIDTVLKVIHGWVTFIYSSKLNDMLSRCTHTLAEETQADSWN